MKQTTIIILALLALLCIFILPSAASALTVKALYAGYDTSYAIADDGSVWAWGEFGEQNNLYPVKVSFIDNVTMLSIKYDFGAVALCSDGTVWRWEPTYNLSFTPTRETDDLYKLYNITEINITNVKYIASTYSTIYMVKDDGSLWVWGENGYGCSFGIPDIPAWSHYYEPLKVPISNVSRVFIDDDGDTFVEKDDGSWWAWGDNSVYNLGDGTNETRYSPEQVNIGDIKEISPGPGESVIGLTGDGRAVVWGNIGGGQAGNPNVDRVNTVGLSIPTEVPGMNDVVAVGDGFGYCIALKENGSVWAWGEFQSSYSHELGSLSSYSPIIVPGLSSNVKAIFVGTEHVLVARSDGTVWAFGENGNGQLGDGTVSSNPVVDHGKAKAVLVKDVTFDFNGWATVTPIPSPISTVTPVVSSNKSEVSSPASSGFPTIAETHLVSPTAVTTNMNFLSIFGNELFDIVLAVVGIIIVAGGAVYLFLRKRD